MAQLTLKRIIQELSKGKLVPEDDFDTHEDRLDSLESYFTDRPSFHVAKTSVQTTTTSLETITWDVKKNTDDEFDLANNKFVVPVGWAGKYIFHASPLVDTSNSHNGDFRFLINGTNQISGGYGDSTSGTSFHTTNGMLLYRLNEGDEVKIVSAPSGGTRAWFGSPGGVHSKFIGYWISE